MNNVIQISKNIQTDRIYFINLAIAALPPFVISQYTDDQLVILGRCIDLEAVEMTLNVLKVA